MPRTCHFAVHQEKDMCNYARMCFASTVIVDHAGVWPSGLVRWLADFVRTVVGLNPSHG